MQSTELSGRQMLPFIHLREHDWDPHLLPQSGLWLVVLECQAPAITSSKFPPLPLSVEVFSLGTGATMWEGIKIGLQRSQLPIRASDCGKSVII